MRSIIFNQILNSLCKSYPSAMPASIVYLVAFAKGGEEDNVTDGG